MSSVRIGEKVRRPVKPLRSLLPGLAFAVLLTSALLMLAPWIAPVAVQFMPFIFTTPERT